MKKLGFCVAALAFLRAILTPVRAGEVAIYTGNVGWISEAAADAQAQICVNKLTAWGIPSTWFPKIADDSPDETDLATWVTAHTNNGQVDVVVLYGAFPATIYPAANAIARRLHRGALHRVHRRRRDHEPRRRHVLRHHGGPNNAYAGLQNMMDNATITQAADNTPMTVTAAGKAIASSLNDFWSDRMFIPSQLAGEWFVEAALGSDHDGYAHRARDHPRRPPRAPDRRVRDERARTGTRREPWRPRSSPGSWASTAGRPPPWGSRAARPMVVATDDTRPTVWAGDALTVTVDLLEATGSGTAAAADVTVDLATDSATGAFDTAAGWGLQRLGDLRHDPRGRVLRGRLLQGHRRRYAHPDRVGGGPHGGDAPGEGLRADLSRRRARWRSTPRLRAGPPRPSPTRRPRSPPTS